MPQATHAPITPATPSSSAPVPSRRRFLTAALAATGLPAAASTASLARHPDAEVLATCAELHVLWAAIESRYGDGPDAIEDDDERDEVLAPIREREYELIWRLHAIPARTADGVRAKARFFSVWDQDFEREAVSDGYLDRVMLATIVRDAARLG